MNIILSAGNFILRMDSKPSKLKRRRVKKIKVRKPSLFATKMAGLFGAAYLENSRQINIGIFLFLLIIAGFILLLAIGTPVFDFKFPSIAERNGEL